MMIPSSTPLLKWTAKESNRISPLRFLKLIIVPALIFPLFAGYNPATFTESDTFPITKAIAEIILLFFRDTIFTDSDILFLAIFYVFSAILSYVFLAVVLSIFVLIFSIVFQNNKCFALHPEGIASGLVNKDKPDYDRFLEWKDIHNYLPFQKNEIKLLDKNKQALMFVNYPPEMENSIKHYIDYYLSMNK